jgi:hypothetical protein
MRKVHAKLLYARECDLGIRSLVHTIWIQKCNITKMLFMSFVPN